MVSTSTSSLSKLFKHTFTFFPIIILLFACQSEDLYAGKAIFRYNIAENITSLDPAFARSLDNVSTVNQIFNGLLELDSNLKVKAAIAKSWEISEDGKRYTFYLRDDVYFHKSEVFGEDSSRRVVAADFVYSLNRLVSDKLISPGKWVMNPVARRKDGSLMITAVNDSTVEIELMKPFPPFLGILSMQYCAVVPKEAVRHYGNDFRSNPIGTGPFKFKYWKENGKLVLLKNEHYFEFDQEGNRLPYLDAIAVSFIKDQEVNFLNFIKGDFDYLSGLKGSYKDEILKSDGELSEKYRSEFRLIKSPYLNSEYLGFNLDSAYLERTNTPLRDVNVRRAINFGFDRHKMLKYLRNGIGTPANQGFIPKGLAAYEVGEIKGFSYQPDSTIKLLEAAGYPMGKEMPKIVLSTTAQYLDICEYIQHQLGNFGIPIEIEVNQAATNNEMIANNRTAFFRKSWVADYPDAENYLSLFLSENFSPSGPNYTHYKNSTYDSLFQEAMLLKNDSLRQLLYQKLNQMIVDDAAVVPLFYDEVVRFVPNYISKLGVNPMNLLVLKYTRKNVLKL